MSRPAWLAQQEQRHRSRMAAFQAMAQAMSIDRAIHKEAPGWHEVGMEISCIPDAVYPWDGEVVRAIQRIAPDVVPVWIRWVWLDPQKNQVIFGRHGLARVNKDKKNEGVHWKVDMPSMPCKGVYFQQPNDDLVIWMEDYSKIAADTPGEFKPFDWSLYYYVVQNYKEHSVADLKQQFIYDKRDRMEKAKQKRQEEQDYIQRDLDKFVSKKLEEAGEVAAKEYFTEGLDQKPQPKPFVHLASK